VTADELILTAAYSIRIRPGLDADTDQKLWSVDLPETRVGGNRRKWRTSVRFMAARQQAKVEKSLWISTESNVKSLTSSRFTRSKECGEEGNLRAATEYSANIQRPLITIYGMRFEIFRRILDSPRLRS
jgi:hypothetical protein